jgi:hypothetical protein
LAELRVRSAVPSVDQNGGRCAIRSAQYAARDLNVAAAVGLAHSLHAPGPTNKVGERGMRPGQAAGADLGAPHRRRCHSGRLDIRTYIDTVGKHSHHVMTVLRGILSGTPAAAAAVHPLILPSSRATYH